MTSPDSTTPGRQHHESAAETARRIAEDGQQAAAADTRIAVTVLLAARHHAWLAGFAGRQGRSIEGAIDLLVRQAWQLDPGRIIDTRPAGPGAVAGSGVRDK